jgi:hypothetical protein
MQVKNPRYKSSSYFMWDSTVLQYYCFIVSYFIALHCIVLYFMFFVVGLAVFNIFLNILRPVTHTTPGLDYCKARLYCVSQSSVHFMLCHVAEPAWWLRYTNMEPDWWLPYTNMEPAWWLRYTNMHCHRLALVSNTSRKSSFNLKSMNHIYFVRNVLIVF